MTTCISHAGRLAVGRGTQDGCFSYTGGTGVGGCDSHNRRSSLFHRVIDMPVFPPSSLRRRQLITALGGLGLLPASLAAWAAPTAHYGDFSGASLGEGAALNGAIAFPQTNAWNRPIANVAIDPRSDALIESIGLSTGLHPDFGAGLYRGAPIGIPYVVVPGTQPLVPVRFVAYRDESDPGPYPIPPDAPIEGGPKGDGDRHILVLDRDSRKLWELFNAFPDGKGGWKADSGAVWNLNENEVRTAGWTSADAAGLPILPGLVRYDEVIGAGVVEHAMRFTVSKSRRAYVPPASHWASSIHDADLPPMGMRVRLKAGYDTSGFGSEAKVILEALKKYGMILADNGSDNFISGAPDERWDVDKLRELMKVTSKDLEVVEMSDMVSDEKEK